MNKEEVIALMKSSKSEQEWNNNCNIVKKNCGGYPEWWYQEIIAPGVLHETRLKFGW